MSEDVKINIKFTKEGEAARQAKQEIEDLKTSATAGAGAMRGLAQRTSGLQMVLSSLTMVASGAANGVRGLATALAGMFQVIVAHPIGRFIAVLAMLGAALYQLYDKFAHAKKGAEELKKEAEIGHTAFKKIADLKFATIQASINELNESLDQMLRNSDTLFTSLKTLREANLAVETAKVNKAVAYGEISEEEGERRKLVLRRDTETDLRRNEEKALREKQKSIESTDQELRKKLESLEKEKAAFESSFGKTSQAALAAGAVTPEELVAGDFSQAKERAQSAVKSSERKRFYHTGMNTLPVADQKYNENVAISRQNLFLVEQVDRLSRLNEPGQKNYAAEAPNIRRQLEENDIRFRQIQNRLNALEKEQQAATIQFKADVHSVNVQETERKQTASAKLDKDFEEYVKEYEKKGLESFRTASQPRVESAVQQQRAEAESAKIRLQSAQRAAGAKGQSPRQRAASAAALKNAQQEFYGESADVAQATVIAEKISKATDASSLQALLEALENIGSSVQQLVQQTTAKANQVASQIKNGGVRTQ